MMTTPKVKSKPTTRMPQEGGASDHGPANGFIGETTSVRTLEPKEHGGGDRPVSGRCETLVSISAAELVVLPK